MSIFFIILHIKSTKITFKVEIYFYDINELHKSINIVFYLKSKLY